MDDPGFIGAVLHLTAFGVLDRLRDVRRHRSNLRIRHQSTWTEDLAQLTDDAHRVRRRDHDVEIHEAFLDLRREIVEADNVGARVLRSLNLVALGEHGDAHFLPNAGRQDHGSAHRLIGLLRIDAEIHRDVD